MWDFLKSTRPNPTAVVVREPADIAGASQAALVRVSTIEVTFSRDDPPTFECVYTASLPRNCRLKVRLRTSHGHRFDMSEITQANGRWVLFDVKAPANKILDRELLPDVEALCREILRIDRDFIASDPSEYIDTKGQTWRRVS